MTFVWLLQFYILATLTVTSGPTCNSARLWRLYSAARLGHNDLLFHSVKLSGHQVNHSFHYPDNAEHLSKKWQASIL